MTTTYELYTNENGTPKAVEGKAPAIVERVENLETSVETAQATADACLPLSGGTVTGAIYGEGGIIRGKTDASDVWISGGTNSSSNSYIQINGGSRTNQAGEIILVPKTPTGSYSLRATSSGALTWGGKDVITSARGAFVGNIFGITENQDFNISADNEGLFNGAQLCLRAKDNSYLSGSWELVARDKGGNSSSLLAQANGTLTWGGKPVALINGSHWSQPGYYIVGNLCIQWGVVFCAKDTHVTVNFATPFTSLASITTSEAPTTAQTWNLHVSDLTDSYVTFYSSGTDRYVRFIAVGMA